MSVKMKMYSMIQGLYYLQDYIIYNVNKCTVNMSKLIQGNRILKLKLPHQDSMNRKSQNLPIEMSKKPQINAAC